RGDLERQIEFLRKKFPNHEILQDIGSGLNYKRKGFQTLLERVYQGTVQEACDEHFTSKTCGNCGFLNFTLGQKKIFSCPQCSIEMDRDVNAARNILLRFLTLNESQILGSGA